MMNALLNFSLLLAGPQDAAPAPWTTDVKVARESALKQGRACVIFLYVDSL